MLILSLEFIRVMFVFKEFDENILNGLSFDNSIPEARINHGTVLLAWYVSVTSGIKRIVELGAGSAAVSIRLAKDNPSAEVTAVEIDDSLCTVAKNNCILNNLGDNISIIKKDIAGLRDIYKSGYFDMVVSNPPHYLHNGIESPNEVRNKARRLKDKDMSKFVRASGYLLKTRGIFFYVLHPRDLTKWIHTMEEEGMGIHRLRFVYGRHNSQAQLVLIQGRMASTSEVVVEPPIILRQGR